MAITSLKSGISTRSGMAGNTLIYPGSYESIATTTLTTATASITFSSIPATYTHLQIRGIAQKSTNSDNTHIVLNGDTGSNYATHYLIGNGSTASAGAEASTTRAYIDVLTQSSTSFSASITDILDYTNTNKYKTIRTLAGIDLNGTGNVWLASGLWMSSSAVTSITLRPTAAQNFATYTSFALYGIA